MDDGPGDPEESSITDTRDFNNNGGKGFVLLYLCKF